VTETDVYNSAAAGKITEQQGKEIIENAKGSPLARVGNLTAEQALNVYDIANDKERGQILPYLRSKVANLGNLDPDTRKEVELRMAKVFKDTGNDAFVPSQVDAELERLNYQGLRTVSAVPKEIRPSPEMTEELGLTPGTKIPLGPREQGEYQELRAATARTALAKMFSDPQYKQMHDDEKLDEVRGMIRDGDAWALEEMMQRVVSRRLGNQRQDQGLPAPPQSHTLPIAAPGGM
jgi:hypothetical protein